MNETKKPIPDNIKYNPLKDLKFLIVLILSVLIAFVPSCTIMSYGIQDPHELGMVVGFIAFAISWPSWIVFRKGSKISIIEGFIIAFILVFAIEYISRVTSIATLSTESSRRDRITSIKIQAAIERERMK